MPHNTDPPISKVRSLTLDSTAQAIKASKGVVTGISVMNRHSAEIFFKLYNLAHGIVSPASHVPLYTFRIPQDAQLILRSSESPWDFSTAISMRCVTDIGDTGTNAAGTLPIVEIDYK